VGERCSDGKPRNVAILWYSFKIMYRRYHLETDMAPEIEPFPNRTRVKVKKHRLALHLVKELVRHRRHLPVAVSRPCVYGVFSGPVGGFAPRGQKCVGCLRCMMEYPDMSRVSPNPERRLLGDSFFTPDLVDTVYYEARTGAIPVKGGGYRGPFGGEGWDGMWTDMSEIVRPTRDGIHGREFISTTVNLGCALPFLVFDEAGRPACAGRPTLAVPIPTLLDAPPASLLSETLAEIVAAASRRAETLAILPVRTVRQFGLGGPHIVPLAGRQDVDALRDLRWTPVMIELEDGDETLRREVEKLFPASVVCLRVEFGRLEGLLEHARDGAGVFHLVADYHGRAADGRFVLDLIREAHQLFVQAGCRDEVTLVGSGGIVAAEHVPKAIISGLDAVALDTPVLAALQARFLGECASRSSSRFGLPRNLTMEWGAQRIVNLLASWHEQLHEVMGAMGLREVRRLRGESGRAMFQKVLEREAFSEIAGYRAQSHD
jgi:hypothetical protein